MPPHSDAVQKHDKLTALLGPPALLPEEAIPRYRELTQEMLRDFAPQDMMELIYLRDIIDQQWEIQRCRLMKAKSFAAWSHIGVDQLLEARGVPDEERESLRQGWACGHRGSISRVKGILRKAGLSEASVSAQTFIAELDTFERLDVMISRAEVRRNAALEQLLRYSEDKARLVERRHAARQKLLAERLAAREFP